MLLQADLSCRHTRQSVGTIYTRTNFVTLKYVTDSWGSDTNGFHLVITAFKDKSIIRFFLYCRKKNLLSWYFINSITYLTVNVLFRPLIFILKIYGYRALFYDRICIFAAELVCRDFRCAQKDFCISTDLLCDGVNHCGDNSDETTTSLCAGEFNCNVFFSFSSFFFLLTKK